MIKQSANLRAMIKRKALVREGTPEAEAKAENILKVVESNGGLTAEEVYSLMAY